MLRDVINLPGGGMLLLGGFKRGWSCRMGWHKEIHHPHSAASLCTVACKRCGELLWQHDLEGC